MLHNLKFATLIFWHTVPYYRKTFYCQISIISIIISLLCLNKILYKFTALKKKGINVALIVLFGSFSLPFIATNFFSFSFFSFIFFDVDSTS